MLTIEGFGIKQEKKEVVGLLGTCNTEFLENIYSKLGKKAFLYLYDSRFSPLPDLDLNEYDYFVVGLTLRYIVADADVNKDDFWYIKNPNRSVYLGNLETAQRIISRHVDMISLALAGKDVFYLSFIEPQSNPLGLFADHYALNNPSVFVRHMNEHLALAVSAKNSSYFVNLNTILSGIGKTKLQDDVLYSIMHGNVLSDFDYERDQGRIIPVIPAKELFDTCNIDQDYAHGVIECIENMRAIKTGVGRVKLIIVDLDGTMWRGVAAEDDMDEYVRTEGWPTGFVEALLLFKSRGGLLAINSKNDFEETKIRFDKIWGYKICFEDFVSVQINWESKSENIKSILTEVNILADNAVMIDDNPREISEINSIFPELRNLGFNPYLWRYAILYYPEFQNNLITEESSNRTKLVNAAKNRSYKESMAEDRGAWLIGLGLRVVGCVLKDRSDQAYNRILELINKTNQFNTTGRRWADEEFANFLTEFGPVLYFTAQDNEVNNGIIGVCVIKSGVVEQMVLSCRVFALGIEEVMFYVVQNNIAKSLNKKSITSLFKKNPIQSQKVDVILRFNDTGKNATARSVFNKFEFKYVDNDIYVTDFIFEVPGWIGFSKQ